MVDIHPVLVEVYNGASHVVSSGRRLELGASWARSTTRVRALQFGHCYVRVIVDLFHLHGHGAFHGVNGELGLLGGVHVRELVLRPSFLASDLTS